MTEKPEPVIDNPIPVNIRTGQSLQVEKTTSADLGHPTCPKCGGKQSQEVSGASGMRHCSNCGNIWEA